MTSQTLETWTAIDGQTFATEASTVKGKERKIQLPGSTLSIADLKWEVLGHNREGEVTGWVKQIGTRRFIIFND